MRKLVTISNYAAGIAILLLLYWVFVFIVVNVFGLRVFRENLSETFSLSVMGIIALMAGSLMINLMLNMSRIADRQEGVESVSRFGNLSVRSLAIGLIAVFPIVTGLLFAGDYLTSSKKETMLVTAAKTLINSHSAEVKNISDYRFDEKWLQDTSSAVQLMQRTDENIPAMGIIVRDKEGDRELFLRFDTVRTLDEDDPPRDKLDFVYPTSVEERVYLSSVFAGGNAEYRFSASDGNYELYYPYFNGDRKIVFYFSDYQQYGKIGS